METALVMPGCFPNEGEGEKGEGRKLKGEGIWEGFGGRGGDCGGRGSEGIHPF